MQQFSNFFISGPLYTTLKSFCICGVYQKLDIENTHLLQDSLHVKVNNNFMKSNGFPTKNRIVTLLYNFAYLLPQLDSHSCLCNSVCCDVLFKLKY